MLPVIFLKVVTKVASMWNDCLVGLKMLRGWGEGGGGRGRNGQVVGLRPPSDRRREDRGVDSRDGMWGRQGCSQ